MDARYAETIEFSPLGTIDSSTAPGVSSIESPDAAPRVGVVAGRGPDLSSETRSLLRRRLRAATGFMAFASACLLVASHFLGAGTIRWVHLGLVLVLLAVVVGLSPRWAPRGRWLRGLELLIFAMVIASIIVRQYQLELIRSHQDDPAQLVLSIKDGIVSVVIVMMIYGMFIPNTWRRAAAVVIPMALSPVLVPLSLIWLHPDFAYHARRIASPELLAGNALALGIGAALAIFGTHIINALRVAAFEARQMGQYYLRHKLGAGGMGEVYLAEHQLLKRPCALKLIRVGSESSPKALERFEREVRLTATLSHPNTVEIYDYGRTEDGTYYYVMEYLRGLSLADLVERHGPLPPGRAVYLLRQVCLSLREAHAAGLIHRDIKPSNIFASRRGGMDDVAKLFDFGLVLSLAKGGDPRVTGEGRIFGTPLFMSPEQATGERDLDGRCDIYSLGAVAYYLLTGRPPFRGEDGIGLMIAHARDPVAPPSQLCPDIPEDLERVVLRCLAKDPGDRFPNAESLERALGECDCASDWDQDRAARWWSDAG